MKTILNKLVQGEPAGDKDVSHLMEKLMCGEVDPAMAGALLALQMRNGIDGPQLMAALEVMMSHARSFEVHDPFAVDNCGTGGDGGISFNVSTTAAFVIAGAGHTVAKHGNRAVSSKCGSADLLEKLDIRLDMSPGRAKACIDEVGIGFLFAPIFHPAVKNVVPIRKALGVRTIFNLLGPLANPAQVKCQLVGVFDEALTEIFAEVLAQRGSRAFIVWGEDGSDEVSLTTRTKVTEVRDGDFESHIFDPRRHGFDLYEGKLLEGGTLERNLDIFLDVLREGSDGPPTDLVVLNAGFAMYTTGKYESLEDAFEAARASQSSGKAWEKVEALRNWTRKELTQ